MQSSVAKVLFNTNHLNAGKDSQALPLQHVAIIMDGNRRWAASRKLPHMIGHKEGVASLKRLVQHVGKLGLNYLTVYAFSTENWNRSEEEVSYLFDLFINALKTEFAELAKNGVRLTFLGKLSKLPPTLLRSIEQAMEETKPNSGLSLQIAINYGSRLEITEAVKHIVQAVQEGKLPAKDIDEGLISSYLYTKDIPDPDLLIRTGGQMRLSNYLLWQTAYTELYVTDVLWPEFTPAEFDRSIIEFSQRSRRYGGD